MADAPSRLLLSGNEAVARAALDARVDVATGYPGTPSTEILEALAQAGGPASWAPNEKVAVEVALGAALGRGRALAAMKHVGLNVAADPFFSSAYVEVPGGFVVVSCDDPGMFSSQNEQDNRRYAQAAGVPMLEPSDSQDAYDLTRQAFELSERWRVPVLLRLTTRVCHSRSAVTVAGPGPERAPARFDRDVPGRVLLPAFSRRAHRRLRRTLAEIARWNEASALVREVRRGRELGIVTSGVAFAHSLEAAPGASVLKLGMTSPLPLERVRAFAASVDRCVVVEEGDPYLEELIRAAGIEVEGKGVGSELQLGELTVARVRAFLDPSAPAPAPQVEQGAAPQLCPACPHRAVLGVLAELRCIVAGDIGCYTLGALPPYETIDSTLCMGASIGMGLGLRRVLPEAEARRVVSIIGDSTFVHGGITPLVEMTYNPPPTGHVVIILDNETTAMTGQQDHPATGVTLGRAATHRLDLEALARAVGVRNVQVRDVKRDVEGFRQALVEALAGDEPTVFIARRTCLLKRKARPEALAPDPSPPGPLSTSRGEGEIHAWSGEGAGERVPGAEVTNVVVVGLGGQGVIRASDILADVMFAAGLDVKKAEVHGMSQRGGVVTSDVRFGAEVLSPMVPAGEAHFVMLLDPAAEPWCAALLGPGGRIVSPADVEVEQLPSARALNVALLGALSLHLPAPEAAWADAIRRAFRPAHHEANLAAFALGRCGRPRRAEGGA